MKRIISTASMLAALILSVCNASYAQTPRPSPTQTPSPCQAPSPVQCCGKKPEFSDPAYSGVFTGKVAVATSYPGNGNGFVLEVIDLKNQSSFPPNVGPPTVNPAFYHGPPGNQWTQNRLGTVFGLTLDNQGNIYVTSTIAYNGDFFPVGATGGEVYKINGVTGLSSVFATLPNPHHGGLGNITYDCTHTKFYVSDPDNGLIYRLDGTSGAVPTSWNHGGQPSVNISDTHGVGEALTPLGRRIWGLQQYNGRLYYAVVWEDNHHPNSSHNSEIWSVALNPTLGANYGDFIGPAQQEVSLPNNVFGMSMPVSDLSFGPVGTLLVAERSMDDETTTNSHMSRVLEYTCQSGAWTVLNANKYTFNPNRPYSAAGGVDYDFSPGGLVWASGDALHYPPLPVSVPPETDLIYGIEGLDPINGGNTHNSILIDEDGISNYYKTQLGDVEIPCPASALPSCDADFGSTTVCPGAATIFTDLSNGASSWNWDFGDNTTSIQQNPTHVYATSGTYTVTLWTNGGTCTVTHTVIVSPAPPVPVITGPATTCQSGTYSIPPQAGIITWTITNGTPASGTGASINVTWNSTGNGLVTVTVGNSDNCCKTTAQLIVHPCDTAECCDGINGVAASNSPVAVGAGVYTFTPTLTAGPNLITQVSATVISTSLTFSSTACGTSGPVNSYITSATSPAGFSSSLPVQFSRDVIWASSSSAGANLSGGLAFPFNIHFPLPPTGRFCGDTVSFCVEYTLTDVNCRTCKLIRCYSFQRGGPPINQPTKRR